MTRIAVSPCSPLSARRELMPDAALLAREMFNCTPAEFAEELGRVGPDLWHTHCIERDAGASVFITVDGSASNGSGQMPGECRHALQLQRLAHGPVNEAPGGCQATLTPSG